MIRKSILHSLPQFFFVCALSISALVQAQTSTSLRLTPANLSIYVGYFKARITPKCKIPENRWSEVFSHTDFSPYTNCFTADQTTLRSVCKQATVDAVLLKRGNAVCDSIALQAQSSQGKEIGGKETKTGSVITETRRETTQSNQAAGGFVAGPCFGPSHCEPQKPVFEWGIVGRGVQGYLQNTFVNKDGFNVYAQPDVPCDASHDKQVIAVDFGYEVIPMVCMTAGGPDKMEMYASLTKNADLSGKEPIIISKNGKYEWSIEVAAAPLEKNEMRICTSPSTTCTWKTVGLSFTPESGCAKLKCVRTDAGGPVKTVKSQEGQIQSSESRAPAGLPSLSGGQNDGDRSY